MQIQLRQHLGVEVQQELCLFFNDVLGANKMTQWVMMIANKPHPLRLIPENHMVEENQPL